ncbi:hypothetical protein NNC19_15760 [Clostridium sp. SHJSY1]|uniref:hypothetical protein n=1 Tax=Clostridium sp. SHJSY1 TaxID=2942483 RepID=UPI0028764E2B|nr:hypothetical protein [Clostridium sp. SHJSY1]MDS0527147.1 hypothetical protein [Clostridium sp. SHJSY1]
MKKLKLKTLIVGVLSTLLLTSTVTMAKTNTNTSIINKNSNSVANDNGTVYGGMLFGYADALHFDRTLPTFQDLVNQLTPLGSNRNLNTLYDVFFWSSDEAKTAYVYIGTYKMQSGDNNPYASCDNVQCSYDFVRNSGTTDIKGFSVPQGRHTIKLVESTRDFKDPIDFYIDYMNFRVSSLSSYNLNAAVPITQEFKYKLPKQIASNANLSDYVGVFDANTGNQVSASIKLASDNQTLIVDPPNGQYEKNSSYQLIINCGIPFADNSELYDVTLINFITKDTTPTNNTTSLLSNQSLLNFKERSLKSINLDGNNLLNNKNLKDTSKDKSSTSLQNVYKLKNSSQK